MRTSTVYTRDYIFLLNLENYSLCDPIYKCSSHITKPCDKCGRYSGSEIIGYLPRHIHSIAIDNIPLLQQQFDPIKLAEEETTTYSPEFDQIYRVGFVKGIMKVESLMNKEIFTRKDMLDIAQSYYINGIKQQITNTTNGYDVEAAVEYDLDEVYSRKKFIPDFLIVGECNCPCHRGSGIRHVVACCHPKKIIKKIDNKVIGKWV